MHMMWIIPQFVVMTLGEVMYSVTGLEFSYSQSPESMKSVIQSAWQLTVGVGNLIVVIITGAKFFESQVSGHSLSKIFSDFLFNDKFCLLQKANEFFLFAGLMFIDMAIFAVLAYRYKYQYVSTEATEEETLPITEGRSDEDEKDAKAVAKADGQANPSYKDD